MQLSTAPGIKRTGLILSPNVSHSELVVTPYKLSFNVKTYPDRRNLVSYLKYLEKNVFEPISGLLSQVSMSTPVLGKTKYDRETIQFV